MTVITMPTIEERTEEPYVSIPIRVSLKEWGRANALVAEVFGWLAGHNIAPAGAPFFRYWIIGDMDAPFDLEVGVPVAAPVAGDERVQAGSVQAGRYLTYIHNGHPDQLNRVHNELQSWAAEHQVSFKTLLQENSWAGRYEFFLTNPEEQPDPNQWSIEVAYQIEDGAVCA